MTAAPQSIQPITALLPCPFCKKPPGSKVGPPALARCITPECEGTKLAAYSFAEWNTHAAPPSTETPESANTPWRIQIVGKSGHVIDVLNNTITLFDPDKDADFWASMVVAVNSHAALTAKVAELTRALGEALAVLPIAKIEDNVFNVPEITAHNEGIDKVIGKVRAALDNADGGRG